MAKLKLKVVLVPIQFSDIPSSNLESSQSRRFLHLADADSDLGKVCDELTKRYAKIYPDDDKLAILSLQDDDRCDLDPDFQAGDVLASGDIIRVIVENELQNLSNHSFNQLQNITVENTPAVMRLVDLNKQTQSTPLYPPAPVLAQDSTFQSNSRKRAKEYFDLTDTKIPTKHARRTVWSSRNESFIETNVPAIPLTPQLHVSKKRQNTSSPSKTQNLDIEDINETNISLPPPEIGNDRSIPKKKSSSTKPKEEALPGKKRITSGMLSMPAHAQLEKEEIQHQKSKLLKPNEVNLSLSTELDSELESQSYSDLGSDGMGSEPKDKSVKAGVDDISKDEEVEDRPLASLYKESIESPDIREETLTKTEIMNLFKNGMKIPARLQNKSQNESARSRNLSALMKNLEIDMVDKNPVLSFEERRATRAAVNRKTRTSLKRSSKSKAVDTNEKDSSSIDSISGMKKGAQSNSSHTKSNESISSDSKSFEKKDSESKSSNPEDSNSKKSNSTSPNSKNSDPRHAIKYISNPSELLNSLKSIAGLKNETSTKNKNGAFSPHNNKSIGILKDTQTKEETKNINIKKAEANDSKQVKKTISESGNADKEIQKKAKESANISAYNGKKVKDEVKVKEIKPQSSPEGFQPSFTDLTGTSKLGALFEKMKQFDEKLNVLNKKGRYNTKQISQRDIDNIEPNSQPKDRIVEPQINTTKPIYSPKADTSINITKVHVTPSKKQQTQDSTQAAKLHTPDGSKNAQYKKNSGILTETRQNQQIGNLGVDANLNSYPISYNNITSNSHMTKNLSDNSLSNDLKIPMSKAINKDISSLLKNSINESNVVSNTTSATNDKTASSENNSINKSNDINITTNANNSMNKLDNKHGSITGDYSTNKANDESIPATANISTSKSNDKTVPNNVHISSNKINDKYTPNNMDSIMGKTTDKSASNKIINIEQKIDHNAIKANTTNDNNSNSTGNGNIPPNDVAHNKNNIINKVNYSNVKLENKNNVGKTDKLLSNNSGKMSNLNVTNKSLKNKTFTAGDNKMVNKNVTIEHLKSHTPKQGKTTVPSNTIRNVNYNENGEYKDVNPNTANGSKGTKGLSSSHLQHSIPYDHYNQNPVQNIFTELHGPAKPTDNKTNSESNIRAHPPFSNSVNDRNIIMFSAKNGYTNPKLFSNPKVLSNPENFQSSNLQRLEAAIQESNNSKVERPKTNSNNSIGSDRNPPSIAKNGSNLLSKVDKIADSEFKDNSKGLEPTSKLPNTTDTKPLSPVKLKSPNTPTKLAKIHGITLTNSSLALNVAGMAKLAEQRNKPDYANVPPILKYPNEHERIKLRAESIKSSPFILDILPLHGGEAFGKKDSKKGAENLTNQRKLDLNKRKHNESYPNISSSSSDESSSSDSDNNDSDVENKRPRLAAAVPSSTMSRSTALHQSRPIFSPASKEKESHQIHKDDFSVTNNTHESPQKTAEIPNNFQDKANIKKPILTSLSDLAMRGVPDVESTSTIDPETKGKKSNDETTDDESTDEVESSSSSATDSDDSDSDQDTSGKFINIKKLNKGKPKRNKGGFSALMKDARRF
ncbi:uncharacterized protein AC631_03982 [Debaryomyces fabryi]|uniref:Nucleolar protein Dnt1-like N-terminal domain-containing protein n=1 Tax=Debaryomyces fabryi TaxID=58627 RepID=A0A0V1PVG7_9ASCO|nr:uncharacterized protein AC631_03982 [Debaryomyces fabryi]KSA00276.1 hypothetical protein AC631_03982 [Debaryomyces fabryi]CUM50564.1 unnamed protein product [Debaryomyces fabryi]